MRTSSSQDIVAGDIVSKRSLWEQKGSTKPETNIKVSWSLCEGRSPSLFTTGKGLLAGLEALRRQRHIETRAACNHQCNCMHEVPVRKSYKSSSPSKNVGKNPQ